MILGVQMRVNLSLNENNSKDKKIIDFLESKYNSCAYIKEILYQLANDNDEVNILLSNRNKNFETTKQFKEEPEESFDEIMGVEGIEL